MVVLRGCSGGVRAHEGRHVFGGGTAQSNSRDQPITFSFTLPRFAAGAFCVTSVSPVVVRISFSFCGARMALHVRIVAAKGLRIELRAYIRRCFACFAHRAQGRCLITLSEPLTIFAEHEPVVAVDGLG